jgi:molybdopterin synthase catalytic subunit
MEICTSHPIDPADVYDGLVKNGAGAAVLHFAVVKPEDTAFTSCRSSRDTLAELRGIAQAMTAEFSLEDVILIRRTGRVGLGEIVSLVAATAPSSEEAFEACKQCLNRLKLMTTLVQEEAFGAA